MTPNVLARSPKTHSNPTINRLLPRRNRALLLQQQTTDNFPFYPQGVRLSGIDLSPAMLEIARKRAEELGVDADLGEGDAQQLPFADASFDTVVCTLSLCTIPDDRRAIAEMKRVLRPGGRLLLLDHVRASSKVWLGCAAGAGTAPAEVLMRAPAAPAARARSGRGIRGRAEGTL